METDNPIPPTKIVFKLSRNKDGHIRIHSDGGSVQVPDPMYNMINSSLIAFLEVELEYAYKKATDTSINDNLEINEQ